MKGYIYTMFQGADPGTGWVMTDPIYTPIPTLGACMPNIRRAVETGDYIFSISGRVDGTNQYIVGGFQVADKINALMAYSKFPQNRMKQMNDGSLRGNIIVDKDGNKLDIDYHSNHKKRIENYIIGKNEVVISKPDEIKRGRKETLPMLNNLFNTKEDSVYRVVSRWRKLNEQQIHDLISWMNSIKGKN